MRQRQRTPSQQAALLNRERGRIATQQGFTSFPWNTHPNDRYVRVPPSGPFSQAWQGVQKINEISKVGTKRASQYGPMPNPLQTRRHQTERIGMQAWWGGFGSGPVVADAMDQYTQDYINAAPSPSPLRMFIRRLRGFSA